MYSYSRLVIGLLIFVCAARGGLALWSYLTPETVAHTYGLPYDPHSILPYFVRCWAGRDVIVALFVATARRSYLKPLLIACLAIESSDITAAFLGYQEGFFSFQQFIDQVWTIMLALAPESVAFLLILREDSRNAKGKAA